MEAVASKIAGDIAAPVGTYIYETLKKQTGRAKFEKGKNRLHDGFTILRDEKAGGLISPQERLKLLQTHTQLVAARENIDEITNTFYGSLAHRNTAKEFNSKAQKFRKNVETPAERAQMEYELHKAESEIAARKKPIPETSSESGMPEQPAAEKLSSRAHSTGELTRKPTLLDYPRSSDSRLASAGSPPGQRTQSLPDPKTTSASHAHTADSASEVKPTLRRQRHILISSAETYPSHRTPMTNLKSSLESRGLPSYTSKATWASDASEKRQYATSTGAQRFRTAAPPLFNANSENVPLSVPPEPSGVSQHRVRHSRSQIICAGESSTRPQPKLLPRASEQDLESRCRSAHVANHDQSIATRSGAARDLTPLAPPPWEQSRYPTQWAETSGETYLRPCNNQNLHKNLPNFARGELVNPPMYWNIQPPHENPSGDAHPAGACPGQNPYPSGYQGRPCSNCRMEPVQPLVPSTQPAFPHPHLSHSQMPNHYNQLYFRSDSSDPNHWGNRSQSYDNRGHYSDRSSCSISS
ncbi:hypothetical protein B0H16DRAFT_96035 [Mycena metata]|uniref:Uncharacterized protein n=1 Tax=Mycena metata TaxID=1033252 RepID=A0AAD7I9V0_9AGAR|nr:hypothetical protein B0H16DRAFT_96035 [Mycena metata]